MKEKAASSVRWTEWRPFQPPVRFTAACLAETLDGGQAFRWHQNERGEWVGSWGTHRARIRLAPGTQIEWSVPRGSETTPSAIGFYLGASVDYAILRDSLPWRSDPVLARAMGHFPHLRLLRQPLSEALLCFLCSPTKRIAQIKILCQALAKTFGRSLGNGASALPAWQKLALVPESDLRAHGLGFRARNIRATALVLAEDLNWEERVENLPYAQAKSELMQLPGVGEKVADCVLLFGAGKWEAFPVDTWVLKTMERRYGLTGWKNAQIAHFGRTHFGRFAGFAQQFLFAAERRGLLE